MGRAILDYATHGVARHPLIVTSSCFDDDEMPLPHLFRDYAALPPLERSALEACTGTVLDVGAGAGCHSFILQGRGFSVTAIDVSPLSVEAMRLRGVKRVFLTDILDDPEHTPLHHCRFDTILLLMNGLGIAGTADRLVPLLQRLKNLLAPQGQILTDSTDLRYIFEDEAGHFSPPNAETYYGEVDFQMIYGRIKGPRFSWLYADFGLVRTAAAACGLKAECIMEGDHYDYLARLTHC